MSNFPKPRTRLRNEDKFTTQERIAISKAELRRRCRDEQRPQSLSLRSMLNTWLIAKARQKKRNVSKAVARSGGWRR
eukprot:2118184-Pleurochrysis_carterae.AAC.1